MNDGKKQKNIRAERPDKPLFFTMMGVFFLLLTVAPVYWAYYNLGEYRRTETFVRQLRGGSEPFLTPNERQERERLIASNSSSANRYLLEMSLSAAGGCVLFIITLLLFKKASASRKIKTEYEPLERHTIPILKTRIEVKYKNAYGVLFALIIIFFVGMALLICYQVLTSRFESADGKIIKGVLLPLGLLFVPAFIAFLQLRAKRQAVNSFDSSGVLRGDKRQFGWNDFRGAIVQTAFNQRTQRKSVWRVELVFADGESAWIIPNRVKNYEEVFDYINNLPSAVSKN